jgi:hypothetical protein
VTYNRGVAGFLDEMVAWLVPAAGAVDGVDLTSGAGFVVLARAAGTFRLRVRGGAEGPEFSVREVSRFGPYRLYSERVTLSGLLPDTAYEV